MAKTIFLITLCMTVLMIVKTDPLGGIGDLHYHIQIMPAGFTGNGNFR
jgi:hypothetical protein